MIEHKKTRVLLISSDAETSSAYSTVINLSHNFKVIGTRQGGKGLSEDIVAKLPSIIIINFDLRDEDPIDLIAKTRSNFEHVEILLVGVPTDSTTLFAALRAGASGVLSADTGVFDLLEALDEIERGGAPLSPQFARLVVKDYHLNSNSPMTKREMEILQMIAQGKTYSEIADELSIAKDTSKTHIRNIYEKLNVASKSEAIQKARMQKWIKA